MFLTVRLIQNPLKILMLICLPRSQSAWLCLCFGQSASLCLCFGMWVSYLVTSSRIPILPQIERSSWSLGPGKISTTEKPQMGYLLCQAWVFILPVFHRICTWYLFCQICLGFAPGSNWWKIASKICLFVYGRFKPWLWTQRLPSYLKSKDPCDWEAVDSPKICTWPQSTNK